MITPGTPLLHMSPRLLLSSICLIKWMKGFGCAAFFTWLVGPMETEEAEVNGQLQRSVVKIKRCR